MVGYGIDVLWDSGRYDALLRHRRIGLLTNPTGLDTGFRSTVDLLHRRFGLAALFGPEHGVRGDQAPGAQVGDSRDKATGLPVYSLYRRDSKRLTPEMLECFDVLVYDIQDVGSRYYTYLYSLLYALEDCARAGKPVVVLDRPNPLGGLAVEGNRVQPGYFSFVGGYPLCMRYGLTVGEFARMANRDLGAQLTVVPCAGWRREMLWPDTGLPWVMPSPNLARFEAALLYAGTCLFEGTNLSEGRGTAAPFELIGAPYIDDPDALAAALNEKRLPGVRVRPQWFTPASGKHAGRLCGGVQLHVMDARTIRPVRTALELLYEVEKRWGGDFAWQTPLPPATRPHIELLGGDDRLYRKEPLASVLAQYAADEEAFAREKRAFHLYEGEDAVHDGT